MNYKDDNTDTPPLLFNAGIYALGNKYDVPLLKNLAEIKFKAVVKAFDPSMTPTLVEAIKIIYTTTLPSDKGLRNCLTAVYKSHKIALRKDDGFMELFGSGLDDGGLAVDVLDAWADFGSDAVPAITAAPARTWKCIACAEENLFHGGPRLLCLGCNGNTMPRRYWEETF